MAATFDPALTSQRDRARFLLGDTDVPEGALLQDETYDAALAMETDWRVAVAGLATGLASQFALEPDSVSIAGEVSVSWRHRVENWNALAAKLLAEANADAVISSGLQSVAAIREDAIEPEYVYSVLDPLYGAGGGINAYR